MVNYQEYIFEMLPMALSISFQKLIYYEIIWNSQTHKEIFNMNTQN